MSSSCLCPFCFYGWCGELAEQVRTWEGDIYHLPDFRAVTLPAWKSYGQSVEKTEGSGDWITRVTLLTEPLLWSCSFGWQKKKKKWLHHLEANLIITLIHSCCYLVNATVTSACLCHRNFALSLNFCSLDVFNSVKTTLSLDWQLLTFLMYDSASAQACQKSSHACQRLGYVRVPALYLFACIMFPW